MNARFKSIAIYWAGWGFIVLGVLGLFLPILQGILFLLIGLSLLSNSSPWAARLLHRVRQRFPKISKTYDEAMVKAKDYQARILKKAGKRAKEET
ncbi:MAG: PGPGW domain-containing protein [Blastocatellia bacterium]